MIRTILFDDTVGPLERKITKYVNNNLIEIIEWMLDSFSVGMKPEDYFPVKALGLTNKELEQITWDLLYMAKSNIIRDEIKPKYQYVLLKTLELWNDMLRDGIITSFEVDDALAEDIRNACDDEESESLIETITNPINYEEIFFDDYDFLPDFLETIFAGTLREGTIPYGDYSILDYSDYRELMPVDLRELYDEVKNRLLMGATIRMDSDEDFREIVQYLYKLEPTELEQIKQFLITFQKEKQ